MALTIQEFLIILHNHKTDIPITSTNIIYFVLYIELYLTYTSFRVDNQSPQNLKKVPFPAFPPLIPCIDRSEDTAQLVHSCRNMYTAVQC